jgi:Zn-dependent M28 family amino/carboxypeptidase
MAVTLRNHVEAIASRPHNTNFPDELEKSARTIERVLTSLGYMPHAQKFVADGIEVRNIEIVIEPERAAATVLEGVTTLVIGAHYDSAGVAPGANDNGSGVAALLELARLLKSHTMIKTRLRMVFFVNEEPPHFKTARMGSLVYARSLAATREKVRAMLCLETLGAYSDQPGSQRYPAPLSFVLPNTADFIAVVGTLGVRSLAAEITRRFRESVAFPSIGGVAPGLIPGITWSDHWSFGEVGIAAVMITDTALFRYDHYHLPSDTPDKIDYERLARVTTGLARVVRGMAT